MSSLAFAEAVALQAASTALLTEIHDLSVRVSAVLPLVREFRAATGIATLVSPRPANVTNNIIRSAATTPSTAYRGSLTIKVPQ